MNQELAELNAAQHALELVATPDEAKALYDRLEALSQYARRYGVTHEQQNEIARTKLQTARKGGYLLRDATSNDPTRKSLPDGFTRSMSSRWQALARMPDAEFYGALATDENDELTLAAVLYVAKELERQEKRDQNWRLVQEAPRLADITERFPTVVLDPPWDWGDEGDGDQFGRATPTYATMPLDGIAAQPIGDIAEDDAHLFLWITNRSLPKGFALLERWGFRYVTALTWVKPSIGMGNYFRGSTEHVLFGVRGSLPLLRRDVGTHFTADRPGRHSAKPDAFYDLVESCSPGPWLEWPARQTRPGWVTRGAEVPA